jgi:hypothetical protein
MSNATSQSVNRVKRVQIDQMIAAGLTTQQQVDKQIAVGKLEIILPRNTEGSVREQLISAGAKKEDVEALYSARERINKKLGEKSEISAEVWGKHYQIDDKTGKRSARKSEKSEK